MEKSRRHRSCNMDNSHSEQPELLPTFSVRHRLTHHRIAVAGCSKRLMLMLLLLLFKHTSGVTTVTGRTPRTFRSLPSREGALSVAGNFRFDLNDDDGGLDARGVAGSGTLDEDGEGQEQESPRPARKESARLVALEVRTTGAVASVASVLVTLICESWNCTGKNSCRVFLSLR